MNFNNRYSGDYLNIHHGYAEAVEAHEFLSKYSVPYIAYSEDGQMQDENGRKFYYIPLVDRIEWYRKTTNEEKESYDREQS